MKLLAIISVLIFCNISTNTFAQNIERERPTEWKNLVFGGRFMDRFLPMPIQGDLTENTWGAENVIPRYTENGLEDSEWSYWGGNVKQGTDGKYNLFVCRWPENAQKGHMYWPKSTVVHAIAENSFGPYKVHKTIGPGHNPEIFQLKDGKYVIYVTGSYYIADSLNGIWKNKKFEFDKRDRPIIEGLSNLTFAQREDGSYLMVCRGGGIWISETGTSAYKQISNGRVYPPVDGRFEDPVVWKTNIQYHLIVNDWLGRIAYYLRSKDGINWKVDPGEAYLPGIAKYEDGTVVDWYKYERIKVLQDKYGRATQAHFAVIDTSKWEDMGNDNHSSKHICIPLSVGKLITILDSDKINEKTKKIRVKIEAEEGFNPNEDVDVNSLHFGASEEVNFGRGSSVSKTEKQGNDLILTFSGKGNGISDDNFAAKLLGKTKDGKLLFGFARLPWLNYNEPILSARQPQFVKIENGQEVKVKVQNFGQVESAISKLKIIIDNKETVVASGQLPKLKPYEELEIKLMANVIFEKGKKYSIKVLINSENIEDIAYESSFVPIE